MTDAHHSGAARDLVVDRGADALPALGVESGRRFVQQEEFGAPREALGEEGALSLPA